MKCRDCKFWSELMAEAKGNGQVMALCENSQSPYSGKMVAGTSGCSKGTSNLEDDELPF